MRSLLSVLLLCACAGEPDPSLTADAGDPGQPDAADVPRPDGGDPGQPDAGEVPAGEWLTIAGNHIYLPDGQLFHGRGANLHDTRSCNACTWSVPDVAEVNRRADELVDVWGANFVRLTLESYASGEPYQVHWRDLLDDPEYLGHVQEIVAHLAAKPGVYVLLSLWIDPSFSELGWPTAETILVWQRLAEVFRDQPRVLYGLVNEPQYNFDGAQDEEVWTAMNATVAAIRGVEDGFGTPYHVITVQGTGGWARRLGYYVGHPITAGGGVNVAYEVHVYNSEADFQDLWIGPAQTLPVVIGEFGPGGGMTEADSAALLDAARAAGVPHLAWTFHMRCPPNLLVDHSGGGCGAGMPLEPTAWGQLLRDGLAVPW